MSLAQIVIQQTEMFMLNYFFPVFLFVMFLIVYLDLYFRFIKIDDAHKDNVNVMERYMDIQMLRRYRNGQQ